MWIAFGLELFFLKNKNDLLWAGSVGIWIGIVIAYLITFLNEIYEEKKKRKKKKNGKKKKI